MISARNRAGKKLFHRQHVNELFTSCVGPNKDNRTCSFSKQLQRWLAASGSCTSILIPALNPPFLSLPLILQSEGRVATDGFRTIFFPSASAPWTLKTNFDTRDPVCELWNIEFAACYVQRIMRIIRAFDKSQTNLTRVHLLSALEPAFFYVCRTVPK